MPFSYQELTTQGKLKRYFLIGSMLLLIFVAGACASAQPLPDTDESSTTAAGASDAMPDTKSPVTSVDPLPPVMLSIPAAQLETTVEPMGWTVTEIEGERTTKWIVPESAAGWHVTSAGVGASGNLILSGHQVLGDAVFAPLSLGDVDMDQEVLVEDEEGTIYVYQITEISEPIPASGATEAEMAQAMDYIEQTDDALLTLITGWPEFTTTHRVFARAELVGIQE